MTRVGGASQNPRCTLLDSDQDRDSNLKMESRCTWVYVRSCVRARACVLCSDVYECVVVCVCVCRGVYECVCVCVSCTGV